MIPRQICVHQPLLQDKEAALTQQVNSDKIPVQHRSSSWNQNKTTEQPVGTWKAGNLQTNTFANSISSPRTYSCDDYSDSAYNSAFSSTYSSAYGSTGSGIAQFDGSQDGDSLAYNSHRSKQWKHGKFPSWPVTPASGHEYLSSRATSWSGQTEMQDVAISSSLSAVRDHRCGYSGVTSLEKSIAVIGSPSGCSVTLSGERMNDKATGPTHRDETVSPESTRRIFREAAARNQKLRSEKNSMMRLSLTPEKPRKVFLQQGILSADNQNTVETNCYRRQFHKSASCLPSSCQELPPYSDGLVSRLIRSPHTSYPSVTFAVGDCKSSPGVTSDFLVATDKKICDATGTEQTVWSRNRPTSEEIGSKPSHISPVQMTLGPRTTCSAGVNDESPKAGCSEVYQAWTRPHTDATIKEQIDRLPLRGASMLRKLSQEFYGQSSRHSIGQTNQVSLTNLVSPTSQVSRTDLVSLTDQANLANQTHLTDQVSLTNKADQFNQASPVSQAFLTSGTNSKTNDRRLASADESFLGHDNQASLLIQANLTKEASFNSRNYRKFPSDERSCLRRKNEYKDITRHSSDEYRCTAAYDQGGQLSLNSEDGAKQTHYYHNGSTDASFVPQSKGHDLVDHATKDSRSLGSNHLSKAVLQDTSFGKVFAPPQPDDESVDTGLMDSDVPPLPPRKYRSSKTEEESFERHINGQNICSSHSSFAFEVTADDYADELRQQAKKISHSSHHSVVLDSLCFPRVKQLLSPGDKCRAFVEVKEIPSKGKACDASYNSPQIKVTSVKKSFQLANVSTSSDVSNKAKDGPCASVDAVGSPQPQDFESSYLMEGEQKNIGNLNQLKIDIDKQTIVSKHERKCVSLGQNSVQNEKCLSPGKNSSIQEKTCKNRTTADLTKLGKSLSPRSTYNDDRSLSRERKSSSEDRKTKQKASDVERKNLSNERSPSMQEKKSSLDVRENFYDKISFGLEDTSVCWERKCKDLEEEKRGQENLDKLGHKRNNSNQGIDNMKHEIRDKFTRGEKHTTDEEIKSSVHKSRHLGHKEKDFCQIENDCNLKKSSVEMHRNGITVKLKKSGDSRKEADVSNPKRTTDSTNVSCDSSELDSPCKQALGFSGSDYKMSSKVKRKVIVLHNNEAVNYRKPTVEEFDSCCEAKISSDMKKPSADVNNISTTEDCITSEDVLLSKEIQAVNVKKSKSVNRISENDILVKERKTEPKYPASKNDSTVRMMKTNPVIVTKREGVNKRDSTSPVKTRKTQPIKPVAESDGLVVIGGKNAVAAATEPKPSSTVNGIAAVLKGFENSGVQKSSSDWQEAIKNSCLSEVNPSQQQTATTYLIELFAKESNAVGDGNGQFFWFLALRESLWPWLWHPMFTSKVGHASRLDINGAGEISCQPQEDKKKPVIHNQLEKILENLEREKQAIEKEIVDNGVLGSEVTSLARQKLTPKDFEKYKLYVDELEKVLCLLLNLAKRLANTENTIASLPKDACSEERGALISKKNDLLEKYQDAISLSDGIVHRRYQVMENLIIHLSDEEFKGFEQFINSKVRLFLEKQLMEDIFTLYGGQVKSRHTSDR